MWRNWGNLSLPITVLVSVLLYNYPQDNMTCTVTTVPECGSVFFVLDTRYHLARQGREALLYIREWTVELLSSPTPHHVSSKLSSSRPPSGRRIGAKSMIFSEFGFQKMLQNVIKTTLKSGSLNVHIPVANACF